MISTFSLRLSLIDENCMDRTLQNHFCMKRTYDHVALRFTVDSESVEGILDGDFRYWTFASKSPQFLQYVSKGILESSAG